MSPPRTLSALVGWPEPDGAVPLVLALGESPTVVVAGALVAGEGLREPELARMDRDEATALLERLSGQHGLAPVPFHVGLHYLLRVVEAAPEAPVGWDAVLEAIPNEVLLSGRVIDPLARQPTVAEAAEPDAGPLLDAESPVLFGVPPERFAGVHAPLLAALTGPELDHAAIASLVNQLADEALDPASRQRWVLALEMLTARALANPDERGAPLPRCAHQTALAMREGRPGSALPFVRGWVDRGLRELARLVIATGARA